MRTVLEVAALPLPIQSYPCSHCQCNIMDGGQRGATTAWAVLNSDTDQSAFRFDLQCTVVSNPRPQDWAAAAATAGAGASLLVLPRGAAAAAAAASSAILARACSCARRRFRSFCSLVTLRQARELPCSLVVPFDGSQAMKKYKAGDMLLSITGVHPVHKESEQHQDSPRRVPTLPLVLQCMRRQPQSPRHPSCTGARAARCATRVASATRRCGREPCMHGSL